MSKPPASTEAPLVASVIIATYNGASTIGEQLSALAEQVQAPPFEVLVVDNGSTDDLADVVSRFEDSLRVRLIRATEQQGQAFARNHGATHSEARHVLFCDQDDRVSITWVRALTSALDQQPGCFVTSALELRRYNDDTARILFAGSDADVVTPYKVSGYLPFAYGCNLGFRREDFLTIGGFDTSFQGGGEDQDLSWRAIEAGLTLVTVDSFVSYRLRSDAPSLFSQQIGYGRSGNLLRLRYLDRGVVGPSPRWVAANLPHAGLTWARLKLRPDDVSLADAKTAGNVLGSAQALLMYRLRRRMPAPALMPRLGA